MMEHRKGRGLFFAFAAFAFGTSFASHAGAQTAANLAALKGLAPVSALQNSNPGKKALAGNLTVTARIQDGTAHQPTLLPFPEQQQQALSDAFISSGNAYQLADGLGSELAGAYRSKASYTSTDDGKTSHFTNVTPAIADLIAYAYAVSNSDSGWGKYFFANGLDPQMRPAPAEVMAILQGINGTTDVFGKSYGKPAGSADADRYGNSRPFQTEPHFISFSGKDYFDVASSNGVYLRGPAQDLTNSPSYPSGHTTYGYTESLLLALLVPERYEQMVTRGAEYGNDRIILAAHYAMDVLGGRTLALYDVAQLLANKPGYVGVKRGNVQIDDFQRAVATARADLTKTLEAGCGGTIANCAAKDQSRFADQKKNRAFYESTQTYGLAVVNGGSAHGKEDIGSLAPEAGYLLTTAFPYLTLAQADAILTSTEGPGGGFLDDGSAFGVYSRLDLYRAVMQTKAAAPAKPRN